MKNKRKTGLYELQIYPITSSTAFPNLVRLSIPLSYELREWHRRFEKSLPLPVFDIIS
jgi:hypothetical protein